MMDYVYRTDDFKFLFIPMHRMASAIIYGSVFTMGFSYFPTRYRATMYGICYACFKMGGLTALYWQHELAGEVHLLKPGTAGMIFTFISLFFVFFMKKPPRIIDYVPTLKEQKFSQSRWSYMNHNQNSINRL